MAQIEKWRELNKGTIYKWYKKTIKGYTSALMLVPTELSPLLSWKGAGREGAVMGTWTERDIWRGPPPKELWSLGKVTASPKLSLKRETAKEIQCPSLSLLPSSHIPGGLPWLLPTGRQKVKVHQDCPQTLASWKQNMFLKKMKNWVYIWRVKQKISNTAGTRGT